MKTMERRNFSRFPGVTEWPGLYRSIDTRPVGNTSSAQLFLYWLKTLSFADHTIDPDGWKRDGNKSCCFNKCPYDSDIWALFKLFQVRHPLPSELPFSGGFMHQFS
jgi:hypothetical protein